MQVLAICLGLLSCIYLTESAAVSAWTEPVIATGDGSAGVTTAIGEHTAIGASGVTLAATGATAYAITSQPIVGKLTIASTGIVSLASTLDFEITGATYIIVVEGSSADPSTGTATVTLTITDSTTSDPVFTSIYNYVAISDPTAAATTIATVASSNTPTYAIAAGDTDTLFAISSAGVVTVAAGKTIDVKNTLGYILTITAVSTNTGTAYLLVCVGSNCSSSAAINITGSLAMILAAVLLAKLRRE